MSGQPNRQRRKRDKRWDKYKPSELLTRTDVAYGICKKCGRYTYVWLPARLCDRKCIQQANAWRWACAFFGVVI